jgi:hypothetical protein
MAAQHNLLPTNVQNLAISTNSNFANGMYSTQVSLDPMSNPDMLISLYNGVYDSFQVSISCSNAANVTAWSAEGTNLASA